MHFRYRLLKSLAVVLGVVGFTTVVQIPLLFGEPRRSHSDANDVAVTVKNDSIVYKACPVRPVLGGDLFRVAIGGAISSIGIPGLNPNTIHRLPMFSVLFPSFCRTASAGFLYHFYFGYDYDDVLANVTIRNAVVDAFQFADGVQLRMAAGTAAAAPARVPVRGQAGLGAERRHGGRLRRGDGLLLKPKTNY